MSSKGNIIDIWSSTKISKYEICAKEFPHPAFKSTWVPDKRAFESMYSDSKVSFGLREITVCKYNEMEDWLSHHCSGYFLIMPSADRDLSYRIYFENDKDMTFFSLKWKTA